MSGALRVAFLGTPGMAVPSLRACHARMDVRVVITQPDRPRGRSRRPRPSPVKEAALELSLPVSQPGSSGDLVDALRSAGPLDAGILVAYGRLVPPEALAIPEAGILNAHFSLLPRWRGAAPVQHALLAGDARTGVSVMVLGPGLDTGPVVSAWSTPIGDREDAGSLSDRLAAGAADLLPGVAVRYVSGQAVATPQPERGATLAPKLGPADRTIDWTRPSEEVVARIRAMSPRPGATTKVDGADVKVLAATSVPGPDGAPGDLHVGAGGLVATSGSGAVRIDTVQPAGGRAMDAPSWLRGLRSAPRQAG